MAGAFPSNGHSPVDIQEVVKCIICKRELSLKLVQLDCLHSCHEICIRNKLENGSMVTCTACHKTCQVPKYGVEAFPEELLQCKMKDIGDIFGKNNQSCKECELFRYEDMEIVSVSTHFCINCKYYLCSVDASSHKGDCKVVQISEIQTGQYLSQILESKEAVCFKHRNANATKICLKCKVPLCQECTDDTDHKTHPQTTSIINPEVIQRLREELKNKTTEIQYQKNQCDNILDGLQNLLQVIENNSKQQIEKCEKWGNYLKQVVDRIVKRNVQNIKSTTEAEVREIKEIIDTNINQNRQYQSTQDYMKLFLRFGSDTDCLQKYKIFLKNLNDCLEQKSRIEINTTKFDVQLKDVHKVEKSLEKMVKLETVLEYNKIPHPRLRGYDLLSRWSTGEETSGLVVYEEDVLTCEGTIIEVYGMNGQKKSQIECQELGHAEDIEAVNKQLYVIDSEPSKRKILVLDREGKIERQISLPKQEHKSNWQYELCLAVDPIKEDIYIASAETNTLYKCSKGQTMAHSFIKTGLDIPLYLCITPHHEVIVSNEQSHSVSKYNSEGELMWTYEGAGEGQLNRPAGVCVDPQGYIFVCDWCNHRIHHLSPEGYFLSFIDIGEQIQWPLAITFKNEKIIIAGRGHIYVVKCQYN